MTLREEVEQIVEEGYCDGCSALGCNDQSVCSGFKNEVERTLKELATESEPILLKSITEHPDVQRLIIEIEKCNQLKKALKKALLDTNEFYYPKPICRKGDLAYGYNACLSCPMNKVCRMAGNESSKEERMFEKNDCNNVVEVNTQTMRQLLIENEQMKTGYKKILACDFDDKCEATRGLAERYYFVPESIINKAMKKVLLPAGLEL